MLKGQPLQTWMESESEFEFEFAAVCQIVRVRYCLLGWVCFVRGWQQRVEGPMDEQQCGWVRTVSSEWVEQREMSQHSSQQTGRLQRRLM